MTEMTLEEAQALSRPEWCRELLGCLRRISEATAKRQSRIRSKPALGGVFGAGGYILCSIHDIVDGLDETAYYVRSTETHYVVGSGDDRAEALRHARAVLQNIEPLQLSMEMQAFTQWKVQYEEQCARERRQAIEAHREKIRAESPPVVKSIPRRRKQIFEADGGKCHYCATPLTLDGRWHIEHKMPKALGGGNEPGNLVASCVTCNHRKIDTTDIEFKAKLAREAA